ncbi:hypothetical protein [Gallaecimonas sp. GXIMD4217]|uniref:mechanosensitive ion channel family protein n=1 Tax=Gallaecimonas sp. GXIMD4217 TaxID=3131927 RepID=UPI00311AE5A2
MADTFEQLAALAPRLLTVLLLLLLGWLLALVLARLSRSGVSLLLAFLRRTLPSLSGADGPLRRAYAPFVGRLVFWLVMLFFLTAAAQIMEFTLFSDWLDQLLRYLPVLITGLLIMALGYLLGGATRSLILDSALAGRLANRELLARLSQLGVFFLALVIGVEQLGINIHFLTDLLLLLLGVLLAGAALAFGLGARDLVASVIGMQQLRQHCRIGERLALAEGDGLIIEFTATCVVLETEQGRLTLPGKLFLSQCCRLPGQEENTDGPG